MEAVYKDLAERAVSKLKDLEKTSTSSPSHSPTPPRLLIAVAGVPGSGKTTTATTVASIINTVLLPSTPSSPSASCMSMDGFHLTRAELDNLPNPSEAHRRRGAPFTFNASGIVEMIRSCRDCSNDILAPSFDHAIKDPVADDITIPKTARIVIFEGNYLLCDPPPWGEIGGLVDECWFVDVEQGVARERLAQRHLKAGITETIEAAYERAGGSDADNGRWIVEHLGRVDVKVVSVVDPKMV